MTEDIFSLKITKSNSDLGDAYFPVLLSLKDSKVFAFQYISSLIDLQLILSVFNTLRLVSLS